MQPVYEYFPDGTYTVKMKKGVQKFLNNSNRTPGYVNLNGSHNSTFEKNIIGSHRKILFGRRIITGLAYYAYFLLILQLVIGVLVNDFSIKTIILYSILLPFTVFLMIEIYVDTKTTMFSMTSIMSELIMRKIFKKYNAINALNKSWNQVKHRDMSSAIRHEMSNNRDNILFVYATDKTKEMHMKMTYFIISPSMENVWGKLFPSLYNKLSLDFKGGVVHSIHSLSIGTPYSVVSTMNFTISRDKMFMGVTKCILDTFLSKTENDNDLPVCESITNSIHNEVEKFKTKRSSDKISIKTHLFKGVSDCGVIDISGVNFHVQFEVDRLIKNMKNKSISYTDGKNFELA